MVRGCSALVQCIHTQVHKCTKMRFHNILSGDNLGAFLHYENKLTKNIRPTNIWQIYTKFEQIY